MRAFICFWTPLYISRNARVYGKSNMERCNHHLDKQNHGWSTDNDSPGKEAGEHDGVVGPWSTSAKPSTTSDCSGRLMVSIRDINSITVGEFRENNCEDFGLSTRWYGP